jgi:hypothetical protein
MTCPQSHSRLAVDTAQVRLGSTRPKSRAFSGVSPPCGLTLLLTVRWCRRVPSQPTALCFSDLHLHPTSPSAICTSTQFHSDTNRATTKNRRPVPGRQGPSQLKSLNPHPMPTELHLSRHQITCPSYLCPSAFYHSDRKNLEEGR